MRWLDVLFPATMLRVPAIGSVESCLKYCCNSKAMQFSVPTSQRSIGWGDLIMFIKGVLKYLAKRSGLLFESETSNHIIFPQYPLTAPWIQNPYGLSLTVHMSYKTGPLVGISDELYASQYHLLLFP
jgi:hypothetical protein